MLDFGIDDAGFSGKGRRERCGGLSPSRSQVLVLLGKSWSEATPPSGKVALYDYHMTGLGNDVKIPSTLDGNHLVKRTKWIFISVV